MYYNYSDIYLVPKYSELMSRSQADISVNFLGRKFNAPWIPANMESVVNEDMAKWCSENDYFYIMHRFGDTKAFIERANKEKWKTISISIGVHDKELIEWLSHESNCRIDFITIDVAHGHHTLVKEMIPIIKNHFPNAKIIAGNVATPEAVRDLATWGADAVKVGIGGGSPCSTKNQTGFHVPMFSCVKDCCYEITYEPVDVVIKEEFGIPIIADGGIKENGDIAKALVAGASMVMIGGIFAACKDAPGEMIEKNFHKGTYTWSPYKEQYIIGHNDIIKKKFKRYYGSASYNQKEQMKHIEGFEVEVPCNGYTYAEKYQEIKEALQSAISYGGGKDLSCFKDVGWIAVR